MSYSIFPGTLLSELIPGKDFFYTSDLLAMAVKARKLPHPPKLLGHLSDRQLITPDGVLIDGKEDLVRWKELKLEGIKREEDLFREFMIEDGLDEEFTKKLIEHIPDLYEPDLFQPLSARNGQAVKYIPLEHQEERKKLWKRRRHYLQNKV